MDISRLSASNRVLLSAINQMVIPKVSKSNIPMFLELFYCWCVLHGLPFNLPYIILNHIRSALSNKKVDLLYDIVIIAIAKRRNANMDVYTASVHGTYNSRLLQNVGFNIWKRADQV